MSKLSLCPPLKKARKAFCNAFVVSITDTAQQTQPAQQQYELRSWVWLALIVIVVGLVGGRLLFFKVEGNPWQLPLQARSWTGFGESYNNNVSVVTEKGTEADGKTTKHIDKTTTTQTRLQPAKTFWDWASLLLAPATLAGLGFLFQSSQERAKQAQAKADKERSEAQAKADKERIADQQREAALQDYLDYLSVLLVDKQLRQFLPEENKQDEAPTTPNEEATSQDEAPTTASAESSDATRVATVKVEAKIDAVAALDVVKAKTLALFRLFDHADPKDMLRKASVLAFLGDSDLLMPLSLDLIRSHWAKANLRRAKLSGVQLSCADLMGANLEHTDLSGADLSGADLDSADRNGANLNGANLMGTNLTEADRNGAQLDSANLSGADLTRAILWGVDLRTTKALTEAQLQGDEPPFLCHVKLPEGFTVDPQRDCAKLPAVLLKRYPDEYKDLDAAKVFVDSNVPPE